eukprot:scaffold650862_cov45-Prasinocladus_malaysianus.AAC.1
MPTVEHFLKSSSLILLGHDMVSLQEMKISEMRGIARVQQSLESAERGAGTDRESGFVSFSGSSLIDSRIVFVRYDDGNKVLLMIIRRFVRYRHGNYV